MQYLISVSVKAHMAMTCDAGTKMSLLNKLISISAQAHISKKCDARAKIGINLDNLISQSAEAMRS